MYCGTYADFENLIPSLDIQVFVYCCDFIVMITIVPLLIFIKSFGKILVCLFLFFVKGLFIIFFLGSAIVIPFTFPIVYLSCQQEGPWQKFGHQQGKELLLNQQAVDRIIYGISP